MLIPLSKIGLFERFLLKNTPISKAEAQIVSSRFRSVYLKENDYFLKAGMPVRQIGFLVSGVLYQFIIDEKGNQITLQFISGERFFCDANGYYLQEPSETYIQAITPCWLFVLPIDELKMMEEELPQLKLIIAQLGELYLLERLRSADFLRTGTAAEQYNRFVSHFSQLVKQIPLKYIASYLRITQQSLSRIRRLKM